MSLESGCRAICGKKFQGFLDGFIPFLIGFIIFKRVERFKSSRS